MPHTLIEKTWTRKAREAARWIVQAVQRIDSLAEEESLVSISAGITQADIDEIVGPGQLTKADLDAGLVALAAIRTAIKAGSPSQLGKLLKIQQQPGDLTE